MAGGKETRLPAGVATERRFRGCDLQLLTLLGRHTDRDGWCRRRQARMAEELGLTRATVVRAIARLKALGWVEVAHMAGVDGGNATARYRIVTPEAQGELFVAAAEPQKTATPARPPDSSASPPPESHGDSSPDSLHDSSPDSSGESAIEERPLSERPLSERQRNAARAIGHDELDRLLHEAGGDALDPTSTALMVLSEPLRWLAGGCDLEADVLATVRARAAAKPPAWIRSWQFFEAAVVEARDRRLAAVRAPPAELPANVTVLPQQRGDRHAQRKPTLADSLRRIAAGDDDA